MQIFRALSHRSFALLWSGQTISRLGDSLYTVALAWWVLQKTGSAAAMGGVLTCATLPMILCLLFGGVAVDRLPRIRLMLVSDLLRGSVMIVIAFLAFQQWLELWHIFILSILFGMVDAFFYPAYRAIIPDLVPPELLPSSNSLGSLSSQVSQFVGPAIAAGIIALGGTWLAFALEGISFAFSALCLVALPQTPALRNPAEKEEGVLQEVVKGIFTVLHHPWLWLTLIIASVSTIFLVGPLEAALPLLIRQRFGDQVGILALLTSLSSLGSIGGAFSLGQFKRLRRRGLLTYGAWLLASLMLLLAGLPLPVWGLGLAFLVQGASFEILGLAWVNTLQELVPAHLLGRVSSIDYLVSSALLPIGYGLAGLAADRFGAPLIFLLGGALAASIIALGLLHPAIRRVD
ncbi:MAG: MFS transporter [Thermogemmatispora sp.]|uniref:MFS transporter n=1 Tax=Thermogemmatispora sp. TaxID=1968838 RepID=UPI00261BE1AF|nr:MFS transporter [Thermogemmatispora sp.]MBX5458461.1 MFS transporter [Thermogemmatispora sp.]